ncbi:Coq4 family protein [Fretibacter rubidus]|uniref:Coq4 family protein n=1 Tax=Fretibacter rubidus TaxID=570162 RepID=UPI00352AC84C
METKPFRHADRPNMPIRPLKAMRHFRKLIADKEDTRQVFEIIIALDGKEFERDARAFLTSDIGKQRYADHRYLPDVLDDHDSLKQLPEGSVGQAYVAFMEREGLTAAGLVAEYDRFYDESGYPRYDDQMQWYGNRRRDTHDLFHILTGYGRDALGEASVLGFSYGQNRGKGSLFIGYMAALEMKKTLPKNAPTLKSVRQGQRHGNAAHKIIEQDIVALLSEPLDAARARLGIAPPSVYQEVHAMCHENGIDPYGLIAAG